MYKNRTTLALVLSGTEKRYRGNERISKIVYHPSLFYLNDDKSNCIFATKYCHSPSMSQFHFLLCLLILFMRIRELAKHSNQCYYKYYSVLDFANMKIFYGGIGFNIIKPLRALLKWEQ